MLINEKTWDYVRRHVDDDVRKLALQGVKDAAIDLPMALQQIAGRKTARTKLPTWAAVDGISYPPHLNMEQCSSEKTARYKAQIVGKGTSMVDLTGGLGVDFYWLSQQFTHRQYVEQDEALCTLAEQNFHTLGLDCTVRCCEAATYLAEMSPVDLIFLDPARRNEHGGRTYGIADCTPNVLELLPLLLAKADTILLKLSPMLDWRKAVDDITQHLSSTTQHVSEVHIVGVRNECKELLLVLKKTDAPLRLICVNDDSIFEATASPSQHFSFSTSPSTFLHEPNASIMKAGCFAEIEACYPVRQISPNSHLFLSSDEIADFPGRSFEILAVSSTNLQKVYQKFTTDSDNTLLSLKSANISVRNFPLTVDQLRKKLKLKDGGDTYIFATTLADGQHRLFVCRRCLQKYTDTNR